MDRRVVRKDSRHTFSKFQDFCRVSRRTVTTDITTDIATGLLENQRRWSRARAFEENVGLLRRNGLDAVGRWRGTESSATYGAIAERFGSLGIARSRREIAATRIERSIECSRRHQNFFERIETVLSRLYKRIRNG